MSRKLGDADRASVSLPALERLPVGWFSMSPLPRLHHHDIMTIVGLLTYRQYSLAAQTLTQEESGQIPIRVWYCILSSSASNEVGVNINWDVFCIGRSSVIMPRSVNMPKKATACLHSSLNQLTHQEILGVLEMR